MKNLRNDILDALAAVDLPGGGNLISADLIRALTIDDSRVRFVIELADSSLATRMEPLRAAAVAKVEALPGVSSVSVVMTAHGGGSAPSKPAP